jgi:spore maturation protein CgeB
LKLVYFTHSLASCWNHGNAHFLRGVLRDLVHRGHEVTAYEPAEPWSLANMLADHGPGGLDHFRHFYPELNSCSLAPDANLEQLLTNADAVLVHEWNDPALVAAIGTLRKRGAGFTLLFHDTHHRAVSDPQAIRQFDLSGYDGVLAFGETLAEVYRAWGWGSRVFVWHEAADTRLFRPPLHESERRGLVWIGNWGDGERSEELECFLLRPSRTAGLPLDIYGVRYPEHALAMLSRHGAQYCGWLPNPRAPEVFAQHLATVHVPRRFYVDLLPGIPTIRVFEALSCGIPLISAPWDDSEGLFRPGEDYLVARDEGEMLAHMRAVANDAALRESLRRNGLETIQARHSCTHRTGQLLTILATFGATAPLEMSA